MKKVLLTMLIITLACSLAGCISNKDNYLEDTSIPDRTFPPISDPIEIEIPSELKQEGSDPATVKYNLLDFSETSPEKKFSFLDLSAFGIINPDVKVENEVITFSFSNAKNNGWCQAYRIKSTDTLNKAINNLSEDLYLRIFVETSKSLSLNLTIAFEAGEKYYLDTTTATLTTNTGETLDVNTGNASSDAGSNSSIAIPSNFSGWVSLKVSDTRIWKTEISKKPTGIKTIYFDARTPNASEDSFYKLSDICFANAPVGALYKVTKTTKELGFNNMNDELAYKTKELQNAEISYTYCPEYDPVGYPGVKAIWIKGVTIVDKATLVFGYLGVPENTGNEKISGIVLQHGGGGFAYPNWVKMWNDEGYAAIAVCNTGYYPASYGITDFYSASSWTHTLTEELSNGGALVLPPDNDGMSNSSSTLDSQWMYHAVCQTIIESNILRSLPEVDETKVGITGISWGGVITSTVIGYDDRFAFAIPVYGSAFLKDNKSNLGDNYSSEATISLWEPANRIDYVDTKTLWLCWTNDVCFSLNSNSDSYLHTRDYSLLSPIMDLGHGHIEGWIRPEIVRFANSIVNNGNGLIRVASEPVKENGMIVAKIELPNDAKDVQAKLYYLTEKMTYSLNGEQTKTFPNMRTIDQKWKEVDCIVNDNIVSVNIPDDLHSYYIELSFSDGTNRLVTSTAFYES